jgi:hypothetical protein
MDIDKVAIRVSGDPAFFDEVVSEAARLDRSPSWLLGHCLGQMLPRLAGTLATSPHAPKRMLRPHHRTFYVPKDLLLDCGRLAMRLGISADDVLAWAWQASRDDIRAMPSS